MSVVNINGAWKSAGNLVYIITQLSDKTQLDDNFVWRGVHKNGVIETGIGRFVNPTDDKEEKPEVIARWNFQGGNVDANISPPCKGNVIMRGGVAVRIEWQDKDHFESRIDDYTCL
jgi:uncharacterized OB-fold protein